MTTFAQVMAEITGSAPPGPLEQRFATEFRQADSDEPGLVLDDDGIVYLVHSDGTRTPVGGGGAQPAGSDKQIQFNDGGTAFGASPDLVWDAGSLKLVTAENGTAVIEGNGVGVQLQIVGAPGDATHVGGEVTISSGHSAGSGGGQVAISAGDDTVDGDGGSVSISSGSSAEGDGGDVSLRANPGATAGARGGDAFFQAGTGTTHGGNVLVQAGGPDGNVQLYSGDGNQAVELNNSGLFLNGSPVGSVPAIDGGTIGLEVSADITLVDTVPTFWTFDELFSDTTDVTLGVDNQTLTFNVSGWYQVWYSFAIKASATTVKSQVQSFLDTPDTANWTRQTSLGELQLHLNGATSLLEQIVTFMTPPIQFSAADALKFGAVLMETAGSVGDSIVTSNTFASVVRIA